MTDDGTIPPPTDMAAVGIHLSYLRRDFKVVADEIKTISNNYVPNSIFLAEKAVWDNRITHLETENEKRKEFQDTLTGRMWGMSAMAGGIVGILTLLAEHFIK